MSSDVRVAVVGATGAVGAEIIKVLDRTKWRPHRVVPVASPATKIHFVEYGDSNVAVEDARYVDLGDLDAVILAAPEGPCRDLGQAAVREGLAVVDLSGAFRDDADVPLVVPWINPEVLGQALSRNLVAIPEGPALAIASALSPLVRAGVVASVEATVLQPASSWGRDGIEELSRQVTALFNVSTPPRRVFPQGLAFDVMPVVGELEPDSVTDAERRAVAQVQALLGGLPTQVTVVGVPVFSGLSAELRIQTHRRIMPDLISQILEDGGVLLSDDPGARYVPRPRNVEGEALVHAGRLRVSADGTVLRMWVALDNLRATATVAVGTTAALLRDTLRGA
ncbi:MAG: aspartate-semialdehyde dehydrogenase [Kiritimatiellia bacterium]|jgi:aspartate-semialdehyde dehydrogenase